MPPSADEAPPGQSLAVAAEALYLVNLLLLPGLAFLGLAWLYLRQRHAAPPLARSHLRQTFFASLWAGGLLLAANIGILLLGGWHAPGTWVVVILYFTTCHSTLVLLGMVGLSKALAGKPYIYPLIGRADHG